MVITQTRLRAWSNFSSNPLPRGGVLLPSLCELTKLALAFTKASLVGTAYHTRGHSHVDAENMPAPISNMI